MLTMRFAFHMPEACNDGHCAVVVYCSASALRALADIGFFRRGDFVNLSEH